MGSIPRLQTLPAGSNGEKTPRQRLPEAPSPLDKWKERWEEGNNEASPLDKHLRSQTQQLNKLRNSFRQGGSQITEGLKKGGLKIRDGLKQGRSKLRNGLKQGPLKIRNRSKQGRIKIKDCLNHGSYMHKTETTAQKPSKCFFNSTHHFCLSQAPSKAEIDHAKQFGSVFLQVPLVNLPKDPENWARLSVNDQVPVASVDDRGLAGNIGGAPSSFEPITISRRISTDDGDKKPLTSSQSIAPPSDKLALRLLSAQVLTTTARTTTSSLLPDLASISYGGWIQPVPVISTTARSSDPSLSNSKLLQSTPSETSSIFRSVQQQSTSSASPKTTPASRTPARTRSTTTRRYTSTSTASASSSRPKLQTSRQRSSTSTRTSDFKSPSTLQKRPLLVSSRKTPQEARSTLKLPRYHAVPPMKTSIIRPTRFPSTVIGQPETKESPPTMSSQAPLTLIFGPYRPTERNAEPKTQSGENYHPVNSPTTRVPFSKYLSSSAEPSQKAIENGITKSIFNWWRQRSTSPTPNEFLTFLGTSTPVPNLSGPVHSTRKSATRNITAEAHHDLTWARHPDPSPQHLFSSRPPPTLLRAPSVQIRPSREPPGVRPFATVSKPPALSARQALPPKTSNPSSIGSSPLPIASHDLLPSPLPLISRSDGSVQASQPPLLASKPLSFSPQKYSTLPPPRLDSTNVKILPSSLSPPPSSSASAKLPSTAPSHYPGDWARGMEAQEAPSWETQSAPLKSVAKALEEQSSLTPPLSSMMMIVIVTLALLLLLLSLVFVLLLHQQKRKKLPDEKKVETTMGMSGETRVYQNMFISVSRIYQNQKPRAPTPPPSPLALKRSPPLPPPSLPMKMENLHTYTNHDFKKGRFEELQNEETAPADGHQPSAPPEVPKQTIQFFEKLQQVESNIIGKDGENEKIKTKCEGGQGASYSNVKCPNKEGHRKGEDRQTEGKNESGEVANLRETVRGCEEMTEENQTVSIFGPQTVWEKSHLNRQLD